MASSVCVCDGVFETWCVECAPAICSHVGCARKVCLLLISDLLFPLAFHFSFSHNEKKALERQPYFFLHVFFLLLNFKLCFSVPCHPFNKVRYRVNKCFLKHQWRLSNVAVWKYICFHFGNEVATSKPSKYEEGSHWKEGGCEL